MNKIVILFFAFSGIFKGFAQNIADTIALAKDAKVSVPAMQKRSTDSVTVKEKASVKLYPNPVKNKAEIEVRGFEPGNIRLQIIDLNGKIVRDDQRLLISGNENIVLMFALQPGIYFISLKQNALFIKKKMMVQ